MRHRNSSLISLSFACILSRRGSKIGRSKLAAYLLDLDGDERKRLVDFFEDELKTQPTRGRPLACSAAGGNMIGYTAFCYTDSWAPRNADIALNHAKQAMVLAQQGRRLLLELSYNDQGALRTHCGRFRSAMEHADKHCLPISLQDFPRGACGDATLLLAKYLEEHGFGSFNYMLGSRNGHSHAWLQQGDLIVDITADQFPDVADPVIVTRQSDWHNKFQGEAQHVADYEVYDERTRAILGGAYDKVIEMMK